MDKVTLKLTGTLDNNFYEVEQRISMEGVKLTGTPLQVGLVYQTLIGIGYVDIEVHFVDSANIEVYEKCMNAIR